MAKPRFRQYVSLDNRTAKDWSAISRTFRRGIIVLLVVILLAVLGLFVMYRVPFSNSLAGEYKPPVSRSQIEEYSEARWNLHDAHASLLGTYLSWYNRATLSPASNISDLDTAGFRPFLFVDENGNEITIVDDSPDSPGGDGPYYVELFDSRGSGSGYLSRKTMMVSNILGRSWPALEDERVVINPNEYTRIHGQFLPGSPQFEEEYVSFLAHVWDTAVVGYITIYQKLPGSLGELMDGVGLRVNPDCSWPFVSDDGRPRNIRAACEGGIIDRKIVYWQVTPLGGATRGQARYWDQLIPYDDPGTPELITTPTVSSTVVDPGLLGGTRQVMFDIDIMREKLFAVRRLQPEEVDPED